MNLDRRRFLQVAAIGVVAAVVYPACEGDSDRGDSAVDQPGLLRMLGSERVRDLGIQYRSKTPGESSASALRAKISGGRRGPRIPFIGHQSIDDQIRDDFSQGRTALVDGWVLSVTEARQAALFSLTTS
jgi:hypothetical protein